MMHIQLYEQMTWKVERGMLWDTIGRWIFQDDNRRDEEEEEEEVLRCGWD